MDIVFIHGLKLDAVIGCYDWEKVRPQPIVIDIDMAWDNGPAASTDALEHALDYGDVSLRIERLVSASRVELVETLAECIVSTLMKEYGISGIKLRLSKLDAVVNADRVGVQISRGLTF